MRRRNILLDQRTDRLLDRLAAAHSGNPNLVVRHALRQYAATEAVFERIESDPDFQRMVDRSDEDFKAGRFVRHEDVLRAAKEKRRALGGSDCLEPRNPRPVSRTALR